ncbi:hypothetical protein ACL9SW_001847, partial [Campylobacter jejuni]
VVIFIYGLINKQINSSDGINISGIIQHILYFFAFCLFSFFLLGSANRERFLNIIKLYCVCFSVLIASFFYTENMKLNNIEKFIEIKTVYTKSCSNDYNSSNTEFCHLYDYFLDQYKDIQKDYNEYISNSKKQIDSFSFSILAAFLFVTYSFIAYTILLFLEIIFSFPYMQSIANRFCQFFFQSKIKKDI